MKLKERIVAIWQRSAYHKLWKENWHYCTHPESFDEMSPKVFFRRVFKIYGLYFLTLFVYTGLVPLLNLSRIEKYREVIGGAYNQGMIQWSFYAMSVYPWNVIFVAVSFLFLQFFFIVLAYFALWFLGEKDRSFLKLIGIVWSSSLYLLVSIFPVSLLYYVAPPKVEGNMYGIIFFLSLTWIFLLSGYLVHLFFFFRMCKSAFKQNFGRAFLTWLFPMYCYLYLLYWGAN